MSDFQTVEYEAFSVDPGERPQTARKPIRPVRWLLAGLAVGGVVGFATTVELPEQTTSTVDPIAIEGITPPASTPDAVPIVETLAGIEPGVVGTVHVLLETESGASHGILFQQLEQAITIEASVDQDVRPDLGGNSLAHVIEHADGTSIQVITSFGDRVNTDWLGSDVTSWAWSKTGQRDIAWTEPGEFDTTLIHRQVITGPPTEPLEVLGEWELVGFAESKAIAVSGDSISLFDVSGGQTYTRIAAPPIRMTGLWGGLVLGAGAEDSEVLVDLEGTYSAAPEWWNAAASLVLSDPGTGWGAQIVGDTLAVYDPEGRSQFVAVTGAPAWSADGRHLLVPQGSAILIIEAATGDRAWIDLGAPVLATWVA